MPALKTSFATMATGLVLSAGLLGGSASPAFAETAPGASSQASTKSVHIDEVIESAKANNPDKFNETRDILEQSDAFVAFAIASPTWSASLYEISSDNGIPASEY